MAKLRVYEYSGCSTCKKALAWLKKQKIDFESLPIVDQPPTKTELAEMLKLQSGQIKKLFNTSGLLYREMKIGEKNLTETQALELLSKHGKLIKRPFLIGAGVGLVGFKEAEWAAALK
jgi:arsenate reductase